MKKAIVLCSLLCLLGSSVCAQRTISGTVYDDLGNPLEEATVYVTGTRFGTITDEEGHYTVKVPEDEAVIKFTYDSGWSSPEIKIGKDQEILNVIFVPYMPFRYHKPPVSGSQLTKSAKIRGTVLDANRQPLAGASVRVEGTDHRTVTNADGRFQLEVPPGPNVIKFQHEEALPEVKVTVVESCHIDVFVLPSEITDRWERKLKKFRKSNKRNGQR